jgi:hypothetical protein
MGGSPFDRFVVLFTFLMILLPFGTACAVDDNPSPVITKDRFFTEWGFYTGAGYGQVEEGPYVPIFFILHLGVDAGGGRDDSYQGEGEERLSSSWKCGIMQSGAFHSIN